MVTGNTTLWLRVSEGPTTVCIDKRMNSPQSAPQPCKKLGENVPNCKADN